MSLFTVGRAGRRLPPRALALRLIDGRVLRPVHQNTKHRHATGAEKFAFSGRFSGRLHGAFLVALLLQHSWQGRRAGGTRSNSERQASRLEDLASRITRPLVI